MPSEKDSRLKRAGVSGYNKPKRTPNHPTKSHVVVAKEGTQVKTIRFGQQGVTGIVNLPHGRLLSKLVTLRILLKVKCQRLTGPIK